MGRTEEDLRPEVKRELRLGGYLRIVADILGYENNILQYSTNRI